MFLLIKKNPVTTGQRSNFNTSHVSINLFLESNNSTEDMNFNTSHVSINPSVCVQLVSGSEFQYIPCFY